MSSSLGGLTPPTLVGASVLLLAGCVGHLSAAPKSPSEATPAPPKTVSVLSPVVTWEHGLLRFEEPGPVDKPTMTATAAYQACSCSEYAKYSTPQVSFALFTEYDRGTASANDHIALSHVQQPVWVVLFTKVPSAPAGGASLPGEPVEPPIIVNQDVLTVVDDATGRALLQADGEPDAVPVPPPPTSGP